MPPENVGEGVPEERTSAERVASLEIRVTVTVYVLVVLSSWAVTSVRITLDPTAIAPVKAVVPVAPMYCTVVALT